MKIVSLIARVLLGLIFVVFGSNGFLHFLPMPPLPKGPAGQFIGAMFQTHYLYVVSGLQVVGGLLLLIGRFVPLGLVILGPVVVNIVLFHVLMDPSGLPLAIVVTILWLVIAFHFRAAFAGLFASGGS
jgi:putative oxidoreductase